MVPRGGTGCPAHSPSRPPRDLVMSWVNARDGLLLYVPSGAVCLRVGGSGLLPKTKKTRAWRGPKEVPPMTVLVGAPVTAWAQDGLPLFAPSGVVSLVVQDGLLLVVLSGAVSLGARLWGDVPPLAVSFHSDSVKSYGTGVWSVPFGLVAVSSCFSKS